MNSIEQRTTCALLDIVALHKSTPHDVFRHPISRCHHRRWHCWHRASHFAAEAVGTQGRHHGESYNRQVHPPTAFSLTSRLFALQIFEKADAIGGVWRDSRWPGAGVDVPIHFYALWSEPKSDWTQHYAEQAEVLAYWESLVDKHQLRSRVRLRSEYVGSEWDEERHVHVLTIRCRDGGKTYRHEANVLIGANGPLSTPQIPNIPGLDEFKGESFHNLRWRTDVEMRGKRVAVVGNGSSGVQLVVSSRHRKEIGPVCLARLYGE